MSLILEALKKSESQRRLGDTPDLGTPVNSRQRRRSIVPFLVVAIAVASGGGWWLERAPSDDNATAPHTTSIPGKPAARGTPMATKTWPALAAVAPTKPALPTAASMPNAPQSNVAANPAAAAATSSVATGVTVPPRIAAPVAGFQALPPKIALSDTEKAIAAEATALEANNAAQREAMRPVLATDAASVPTQPSELPAEVLPGANTVAHLATAAHPNTLPTPVTAALKPAAVSDAATAPPISAALPAVTLPPSPASQTTAAQTAHAAKKALPATAVATPTAAASTISAPTVSSQAARTAPAPTVAATDAPALQTISDLPYVMRKDMPDIPISMQVYSTDPQRRFVIVEGNRKVEGDSIKDTLALREIRPNGVVLEFRGQRFFVPRPGS